MQSAQERLNQLEVPKKPGSNIENPGRAQASGGSTSGETSRAEMEDQAYDTLIQRTSLCIVTLDLPAEGPLLGLPGAPWTVPFQFCARYSSLFPTP